ncbi:hypothetical protein PORY_001287 [Pneumocystis oryctolagi]|uniref:Uncharacterized protein n=1 Tax=Pneumocystis oryctolagi TaxID=42067 RepID=A0ACB7CBK5_9ASCO|nr:hypothetical protein PORY_001287 [Pneumocystis oryctolagi]
MDNMERWVGIMLEALLPMDHATLKELTAYAMSLPSAAASTVYFKDLLGESEVVNDFISKFNFKKFGLSNKAQSLQSKDADIISKTCSFTDRSFSQVSPNNEKISTGNTKRSKVSRKNLYTVIDDTFTPVEATAPVEASTPSFSGNEAASVHSDSVSSVSFPALTQFRETNMNTGILTSELGVKKSKKACLKLHSLSDINSALKRLELHEIKSEGQKKCYCQARKHPLNSLVPNCLACGKIICVIEGINSWCELISFCNTPLLSREQQMELVKQLRMKKGHILGQSKKAAIGKDTKQLYSTCYVGYNSISNSEFEKKALDAENDKNRLLELDRSNIQNKIIDEATDFDPLCGPDFWASSAERFLMLERQRKALAAMNTPKKKVMTIDLSGKATVETLDTDDEDDVCDNIKEANTSFSKSGQFSLHYNKSSKPVFLNVEKTSFKNFSKLDYILKSQVSRVQDDRDE